MNPHYELPWPPPLSPHFLSCPPPKDGRFVWVNPPFKRDIIVIKPDMHIFCIVQYDLYFLLNVKLLKTLSTDVAATSVNSKINSVHFLRHLFTIFKRQKVNFRSSVYGSSRTCRCWPLNFFLVIDILKM